MGDLDRPTHESSSTAVNMSRKRGRRVNNRK